jgi:hypothetical protein
LPSAVMFRPNLRMTGKEIWRPELRFS